MCVILYGWQVEAYQFPRTALANYLWAKAGGKLKDRLLQACGWEADGLH